MQGVPWTLRRSDRHGAGRAPSAIARVGFVPLPEGAGPLQPANRAGTGPGRLGRAGDDRAPPPGLVARAPVAKLEGTAEVDEVYIVAGHKGQPAEVVKRGGRDGVAGFQVRPDAAGWNRRNHPFSG